MEIKTKTRMGALSGGGVLLLTAILVILNLLSQRLFFRWDWTAGRRYSLSSASKDLVRSLEDPVLIRAYISDGLPQPQATYGRYIRDLLQEYRTASRGRVRVEIANPDESEKQRSEAMSAGVSPARFTQVASDQFQVREGFMGLVLFHQDKQETIPFVQGTDTLEYDISSRIKTMAAKEKKTLGFVTGHNEPPPESLREGPTARLFDQFDVQRVELTTATASRPTALAGSAARERPDALFLIAPKSALTAEEISVLDGFVAQGVPLAVFMCRRNVDLASFRSMAQVTGLEAFLEHYGLKTDRDFVFDRQCQRIQLQSQQGPYSVVNVVNYPAFPLSNRFNKKHLLTKNLDVLGFPFANPITPSAAEGSSLTVTPLAYSSPQSWVSPGLWRVDPYSLSAPVPTDPKGPFVLAAAVEGSTTAFTNPQKQASPIKIVLVGSAHFADPNMPNPEGNALFLAQLAEWFSQDPHLLAIPSKGSPFRPLRQVPDGARQTVKVLGLFLMPALVVAGGVFRWKRRNLYRSQVEKDFQVG